MGKTIWHRRRAAATEAGRLHADGGEDKRQHYASMGADVRDAYDAGYRNHVRELEEAAERQRHPLRQARNRLNNMVERQRQGLPVETELISMIHEIIDYLLEKEDRGAL